MLKMYTSVGHRTYVDEFRRSLGASIRLNDEQSEKCSEVRGSDL